MDIKKMWRSFSLIINYKTYLLTAMSVLCSYLCFKFGLTAKFPDMLVGVAIVFPVVFSIGSAYTRRETALQRWADFRGHAIAIYYATRDWPSDKNNDLPERTRTVTMEMVQRTKEMLMSSKESWENKEEEFYKLFSQLSEITMEMRKYGVQSGEISRVSQYLSKMVIAFDNLKIIFQYRTPITLRTYSKVFIYVFPIVYGPYFASTFHDFSASLEYVMPVLYSFILVSLDNIQDHLEDPFDQVGEDDVNIDANETIRLLV
jgi:predicted membrane chloride channel (bestrophin family)